MKGLKILTSLFIATLIFSSCKRDPMVDLIDTWEFEGYEGTITFNSDGTGYAVLPQGVNDAELLYFNDACSSGATNYFEWTVTEQKNRKGSLELTFGANDSLCGASSFPNYKFYPGGNELNLGVGFVTVDVRRIK
jgi:hypothetical protein